jgi:predicted HAD superfamily Cof-like phosphohydrolase
MANYQDKVREFQIASGQPVSDTPRELTKEEYDFRDTLLQEEIRELQYAIVDNNRVEILDALCDIKYVNDGTANMIGVVQDENWEINNYGTGYKSNEILDLLIEKSTNEVMEINSLVYYLSASFNFTLENFKTALDRVHASNMSKFCYDTKTAERTQEFYKKQGIDTYIEPRNKMTVVYRKEDGKVLKSVEYHPVYLEDLV